MSQLIVSAVSNTIGAISLTQDHRVLRLMSDRGLPGFMFCGVKFKKVVVEGIHCEVYTQVYEYTMYTL